MRTSQESCVLWLQFGECMDIRIIQHQIHQFVLSRFAPEIKWMTLKDEVMSLIYKYIIIDQKYYMVSSTLSSWSGKIFHQSYQDFIKITVLWKVMSIWIDITLSFWVFSQVSCKKVDVCLTLDDLWCSRWQRIWGERGLVDLILFRRALIHARNVNWMPVLPRS